MLLHTLRNKILRHAVQPFNHKFVPLSLSRCMHFKFIADPAPTDFGEFDFFVYCIVCMCVLRLGNLSTVN